jgi:hypothetical protein
MLIAQYDEATGRSTLHQPIDVTTFNDPKPIKIAGGKIATVPGTIKEPEVVPDYMEMPPLEACRTKWDRGVAEHGTVFTKDPVEELYQEMIDTSNYCGVIAQTETDPELCRFATEIQREAQASMLILRDLKRRAAKAGRRYQPVNVAGVRP